MPSQNCKFNSAQANPDWPGVYDIDPKELWEKRKEVVIIDVRRPDEYTGELGHVPGSQLIVLDNLGEKVSSLPKDKTIVFVCRSGARSARASLLATQEGILSCFNMKGGMILWNQLKLEVEGRLGG